MTAFSVQLHARTGEQIVEARGELDSATQHEFEAAGFEAIRTSRAGERIIVDMSGVEFCASAGIRGIVVLTQAAADAGLDLVVRAPSPPVRRVFELAGLGDYMPPPDLPIAGTESAARSGREMPPT